MDIYKIEVKKGKTLGDIQTGEEADLILVELEYEIAGLQTELDQSWAAHTRGVKSDPQWIADTRSDLRDAISAKKALEIYAKQLKKKIRMDEEATRQKILIEAMQRRLTPESWQNAVEEFRENFNAFKRGEYVPAGHNPPPVNTNKAGEAA